MYNHKEIEKKWQNYWEQNKTFKIENPPVTSDTPLNKGEKIIKPKYYCLDMFPYPSGAGLHVGHPEGFTANDILARYKTANGFNVLHPMGWDAFGLPAENYAIKTGTHPRTTTDANINTFKKQIKALGFSYDWDREIDTTDPKYYKWTQWIFLKLFENGLAYEQDLPINYCPSCKTGLANEEVLNDFTCERCGTKVEKKKIRQWVLAITKYAERLLTDVDKLDWPEGIKDMQRNWIGKSEGCEFEMKKSVDNKPLAIILHGWRDNENDVDWHWMEWLKTNLESIGYEVELPILPDPAKPDLEKQLKFLKKYENRITADSIVIGHSMGGFLAMHFVERLNKKINKLICVAPCFNDLIKYVDWSNLEGWEIGSKSMKINYNPEKIKKNSKDWQVFLSKNDKIILYPQAKKHFDSIGVTYIDIENAGHFCEKDGFVKFPQLLNKISDSISVYTTRIDTVFGMTYAVLAPDHHKVNDFITEEQKDACLKYIDEASKKSDQDRTQDDKEKTGVFTGSYVINPYNGKKVPLWIADYVLGNYGTGAVMAVPAHDIRDYEFAKKYNLEIIESIISKSGESSVKEKAFTEYGILIDSGDFSGLSTQDAKIEMAEYAEKNNFGTKKVNFKLRDWLFSRQRYWGEPIPLVHCEKCGIVGEKEENLPILLPETDNFEPSGDGTSPLSKIESFVNCKCPKCGGPGKRETNTMPQWGGSCWYYLRFMDPNNSEKLVDPEVEKYWGQVDSYVGGAEHAVLHLLYARFWHKFLFDIGFVSHDEPFYRLRNQGLILAHAFQRINGGLLANDLVEERNGKYYEIETGNEVERIISKMSKSLKNVINPDEIVEEYGADSLRLYEMYMAEFKDTAPWDTKGIIGVRRFIEKSERLFCAEAKISTEEDNNTMKLLHKTIKKVGEDIENYKFNTAIASLMILVNNGLPKNQELQSEWKNIFVRLLHPFTPHLSEELWERLGNAYSVFKSSWPKYDEKMTIDDTITIAVQVLGKVRGTIEISKDEDKDVILAKAKTDPNISKWLEGKELVKEIYVPGKIVNFVVR